MIFRTMLCSSLLTLMAGSGAAAPLIMLDPGHGGTNTGAQGPSGRVVEKRLTLILARRIQSYLGQWVPEARVALTRGRDEYLTLDQRKRRANAARATLFVSLHFNASESHGQRGYETYLLSRTASDAEAARLAYQENQEHQEVVAGPVTSPTELSSAKDQSSLSKQVIAGILADLRQTAAHTASARLAQTLQRALRRARGPEHDRGVRQASFDVLMGLRMPAALVEVGFLDHSLEGPELAHPALQEQLAVSLAGGIAEFLVASADQERHLAQSATP